MYIYVHTVCILHNIRVRCWTTLCKQLDELLSWIKAISCGQSVHHGLNSCYWEMVNLSDNRGSFYSSYCGTSNWWLESQKLNQTKSLFFFVPGIHIKPFSMAMTKMLIVYWSMLKSPMIYRSFLHLQMGCSTSNPAPTKAEMVARLRRVQVRGTSPEESLSICS